jgi:O-antigen/teichoic acid export membrane protein
MTLIGSATRASKRFVLFGVNIGLLAITSLWFVRSAVGVSSLDTWASVAVGQTLGALGAILVGYGWSISGPTRIAGQTPEDRVGEYADALRIRLLVLPLAALAVLLGLAIIPSIEIGVAFIGALPVLVVAISANFYFVGTASPMLLFVLETLPRTVGTAAAAILMSATVLGVVGGIAVQLAGAILAIACSAIFILRARIGDVFRRRDRGSPRTTVALLMRQRAGILSAILVNFYGGAPILIVSFVAPWALAQFSIVDKLTKQLLAGSSPVTAVLQGWVPKAGAAQLRVRARQAMIISWCVSLVVGALVGVASSPILHWISAGQYTPPVSTQALMGAFVGLFLVQNAVSFSSLAALGRLALVNKSLAVCAPVGLVLVAVLCPAFGVDGALLGVCAGIGVSAIWQSLGVVVGSRGEP